MNFYTLMKKNILRINKFRMNKYKKTLLKISNKQDPLIKLQLLIKHLKNIIYKQIQTLLVLKNL